MDSRLRALAVAIGVGVAGLGVSVVLTLLLGLSTSLAGITLSPTLSIVLSLLLTQGISFLGAGYAYLRNRGIPLSAIGLEMPTGKELAIGLGALILANVSVLVFGLLIQLTGTEPASNQIVSMGLENPEILLVLVPGSFLLIGPGEELLFRGVVQNRLRESFRAVPGVVIASVIFAAIHFGSLSSTDPLAVAGSIGVLLGPSLVLGAVYEYTRNLVIPMLVHGAYNAMRFLALYVLATSDIDMAEAGVSVLVAALP